MYELTINYTYKEQKLQHRVGMEAWEQSRVLDDAWTALEEFRGPIARRSCDITRVTVTSAITLYEKEL